MPFNSFLKEGNFGFVNFVRRPSVCAQPPFIKLRSQTIVCAQPSFRELRLRMASTPLSHRSDYHVIPISLECHPSKRGEF